MHLVVFGANGKTGRLVTALALAAGHQVTAVTRRPCEFPIAGRGLTVAGADARDAAAVAPIVEDADAVVSVLGVPFTREPVGTYSVGTRAVVDAMSSAGVPRLVAVSSTAAYPTRRTKAPLSLRLIEPILTRTIGKTVYDDIRRMETIVRAQPAGLDHRAPVGSVRPRRTNQLPGLATSTRSARSPLGSTWPIIWWRWLLTRPRRARRSSSRPLSTPRVCGR